MGKFTTRAAREKHANMGSFTHLIKNSALNINFVFFVLSITIVSISIFILCSDWGTLDPSFFLGWCIISALFGGIISLVSFLGCLGVQYMRKESGIINIIFYGTPGINETIY